MKENVLQNLTSSSKDSVLIPLKELPFFWHLQWRVEPEKIFYLEEIWNNESWHD
jgi:hypothetical protein